MEGAPLCYTAGVRPLFWTMTLLALMGCDRIVAEVGEPCLNSDECSGDALCFTHGAIARCMLPCEEGMRLCEGGEVCVASSAGDAHVCFLGGDTEVGEHCNEGDECEQGAVCIRQDDSAFCRRACDTDSARCAAAEMCMPLEGRAGYCAEPPTEDMM